MYYDDIARADSTAKCIRVESGNYRPRGYCTRMLYYVHTKQERSTVSTTACVVYDNIGNGGGLDEQSGIVMELS